MSKKSPAAGAAVPVALRVGGGFVALALVLLILGVLSIMQDGWMAGFPVTPRFLALVVAAVLVGAFVTVNTAQRGSLSQVVALGLAVALVILSRLLSAAPLLIIEQYWIFMYAVGAFLCALVIRRSLIPKA